MLVKHLNYGFKRYYLTLKTPSTTSRETTIGKNAYLLEIGEGISKAVLTPYYCKTSGTIDFFLKSILQKLFQKPFPLDEIYYRLKNIIGLKERK